MRKIGVVGFCVVASLWGGPSGSGLNAADVPPFVFVSRTQIQSQGPERTAPVALAGRGKLMVFEAGNVRTLYAPAEVALDPGLPTDVLQPDVAYDARRIAFAGYVPAARGWRIFEINADGTDLRQSTRSDRQLDLARLGDAAASLEHYDDVDPCYLPDGRICFVSTRYPGSAPENRLRATNLYVVNPDGTDLHRITTERFGADTPAVHPRSGQIVYSRWWRTVQSRETAPELPEPDPAAPDPVSPAPPPIPPGSPGYGNVGQGERRPPPPPPPRFPPSSELIFTSPTVLRGVAEEAFPGVNSWFLASINPDGSGLAMFSGFRLDREKTQAYQPTFRANGEAVALFIHQTPLLGVPGTNGLRLFRQGATKPVELAGPQSFAGLATFRKGSVFASAAALDDGRILVSAAQIPSERQEFDIWVHSPTSGSLEIVHGLPGEAELDATPLLARSLPPVIADTTRVRMVEDPPRTVEEAYALGTFTFSCVNIHANAPVDMATAGAPPIGKGLAIEFYMAPQRTASSAHDAPILIASREIGADGKVEIELPAGVPLFEVLRRSDGGLPIGRDGQIYHVGGLNFGHAGGVARCVGCHAGHSMQEVPSDAAAFTNLAPSAVVTTSAPAPENMGGFFAAPALVDRSTAAIAGEWAATTAARETFVKLRWNTPIRAQKVLIHGPQPIAGVSEQIIRGLRVQTYRQFMLQHTVRVTTRILPTGTEVALGQELEFDLLVLTIPDHQVEGTHFAMNGPALAEIEVMAQATGSAPPTSNFLRGDANCDLLLNIGDAVVLLGNLFRGEGPLCCGDAADVNRDDALNVTDVVHLLSFAFRGGEPPAKPFPECGRITAGPLGCDTEPCD